MRRVILLFSVYIFYTHFCFGQIEKDSLKLIIQNVLQTTSGGSNLVKVETYLQNDSRTYPIILPPATMLYAVEKYLDPFLYFELFKLDNKNEYSITEENKMLKMNFDPVGKIVYRVLNPKNKVKIICEPESDYFKKHGSGKYKLRIVYKASLLNRSYNDIFSEWVLFEIK